MRPRRWLHWLRIVVVLLVATVLVVVPLWMMVVNSLKTVGESNALELGLPRDWSAAVSNYQTVLEEGQFAMRFANNLIILVPAVIIVLFLGSAAAWYFGRHQSRMARVLYGFAVVGILVPPAVITTVFLLRALNLFGTYTGLTLFYIGAFLSFAIFIMTGFVNTIPPELEEAATIDGASRLRTFLVVVLPLMRPIFVSSGVVLLFMMWNDFFFPLFLSGSSRKATLVLGLYNFISAGQHQLQYNLLFAGVVVVSLPLLVTLVFAQRYLVEGLTAGSSK